MNPIDMASHVHVFLHGMREGVTHYLIMRANSIERRQHGVTIIQQGTSSGDTCIEPGVHGD